MVQKLIDSIHRIKEPIVLASEIPKNGVNPQFIIEGSALTRYIFEICGQENYEFAKGGHYHHYRDAFVTFITMLKKIHAECAIIFELPKGVSPITEENAAKWDEDTLTQMSVVNHIVNDIQNKRTNLDNDIILPVLFREELSITAKKLKIPIIYTRNDITQYIANAVKSGDFDAVIGTKDDFVIFQGVNFIPIDTLETNDYDEVVCEYMNSTIVSEIIELKDEKLLVDLSILLGNDFTTSFSSYIYGASRQFTRANPKIHKDTVGIYVEFLNSEDYRGLENTEPIKKIIEKHLEEVNKSRKFYSLECDFIEEGSTFINKEAMKGNLPLWILPISEGNDYWCSVNVDESNELINTRKANLPLRKAIYNIIGCKEVTEHVPYDGKIMLEKVAVEDYGFPLVEEVKEMDKSELANSFYSFVHQKFPKKPKFSEDPLLKLHEPLATVGLTLRYILSSCFVDNNALESALCAVNEDVKNDGVINVPPLDYAELKAIAAQAVCVNFLKVNTFKAPMIKPSLRRTHIASLYLNTISLITDLQKVLKLKSEKVCPHRVFDGEIFTSLYESQGIISNDRFTSCWSDSDISSIEEKRLKPLMDAILYPFPANLYERMKKVAKAEVERKKEVIQVKAKKYNSKFAFLMDSDDYDYD